MINEATVESVTDLLVLVDQYELHGEGAVFRGQSLDWPLIPEIGRDAFLLQGRDGYDSWLDFEDNLLNDFKKFSYPYVTDRPKTDWDWMFFARHYGLPTRLLDWSSNPLKGLFFAVQNFRHDKEDSILWAILTKWWSGSMKDSDRKKLSEMDLVYPSHINERIVAQDSCFTVFPLPSKGKEFRVATDERIVDLALKITVPKRALVNLRTELSGLGFSNRTMFPGLDGVAASIRQDAGEGWLTADEKK